MNNTNKSSVEMAGNTGTQRDFLDDCWDFALRRHSGTQGNAGTQPAVPVDRVPCVPPRSEGRSERETPPPAEQSGLCSRVPPEHAQEIVELASTVNWERIASHTLASVDDDETRTQLRRIFEDELEAHLSRSAERWRAARAAYLEMGSTLIALCEEFELRDADDLWNGDAPQ